MTRWLPALIIATLPLLPSVGAGQTSIVLDSQPGDWVGGGQHLVFTSADGTFSARGTFNNGVSVDFHTISFSHFWHLDFGPPTDRPLTSGVYEGAQRFAFHAPPKPGMDVWGDGHGCNTITGRLLVIDVAFAQDGTLERLAIDFEQHCEGAAPALFGSVRINSSAAYVARVSVGDATALKGNAGTSDAIVILSLSRPKQRLARVHYATADGTATEGVDYVGTSGTAEFQPGTTTQTVAVPLLGDRLARGNKKFKVRLDTPERATLGDATAKVKILDPNVPMTVLAFSSQPGDWVGQGQLRLFTIADASFTPSRNFDNGVSLQLEADNFWHLDLAAPDKAPLTPGVYENAQGFPFQDPGRPGLDFSGAGRACGTLTGRFVVKKASYYANGDVKSLKVEFEQHCGGEVPALFGSVCVNAVLRQLSVSNAVIDDGSSLAVFTVTLNPPSPATVTVTFETADGTAQAGVDYAATSQLVTFSPGETEHTVEVQLLSLTGGGIQFFGRLLSPDGAAVWISRASANF